MVYLGEDEENLVFVIMIEGNLYIYINYKCSLIENFYVIFFFKDSIVKLFNY